MANDLGTIYFNGYAFDGRRLDGRARGESAAFPLEGDQGATVMYAVKYENAEEILANILDASLSNNPQSITSVHPDYSKLYAMAADVAPMSPAIGNSLEGLAEPYAAYNLALLTVRYQEDRKWTEVGRAAVEVINTTVLNPGASGQKPYFDEVPIPFSSLNITLSRRRLVSFDPADVEARFTNAVNGDDWTLPSGRVVPKECAMLQTFSYEHHKVAYGKQYYSVNLEFVVKPQSWNKYPTRKTGEFVTITMPDGTTPLWPPVDFSILLADPPSS